LRQCSRRRFTLDLHEIGLLQLEAGIGDPCLQSAVISQQQQSLAIPVKPAGGIIAG